MAIFEGWGKSRNFLQKIRGEKPKWLGASLEMPASSSEPRAPRRPRQGQGKAKVRPRQGSEPRAPSSEPRAPSLELVSISCLNFSIRCLFEIIKMTKMTFLVIFGQNLKKTTIPPLVDFLRFWSKMTKNVILVIFRTYANVQLRYVRVRMRTVPKVHTTPQSNF